MSQVSETQSSTSHGVLPIGLREVPSQLREVPAQLREVPTQLREVPQLPFRAGRHLTAWLMWQTSRVSVLADHDRPHPPDIAA